MIIAFMCFPVPGRFLAPSILARFKEFIIDRTRSGSLMESDGKPPW